MADESPSTPRSSKRTTLKKNQAVLPAPNLSEGAVRRQVAVGEEGRRRREEMLEAAHQAVTAPARAAAVVERRTEQERQREKEAQHLEAKGKLRKLGEDSWAIEERMSLWWVLAGVSCVLLVGYFLVQAIDRVKRGEQLASPDRVELALNLDDAPIAALVSRSGDMFPEVETILAAIIEADGDPPADLIRGGEAGLAKRREWQARTNGAARFEVKTNRELHAAAIGDTGYLLLTGIDPDHSQAVAYFVEEEDGSYLFDWEASEGYCELLPSDVDRLNDDEPRVMRVVISLGNYYAPGFPEDEYQCYAFHNLPNQTDEKYIWGFAKRDSPVDRRLMASYEDPDVLGTDRRVTVKVGRGPADSRKNHVEIVEYLHTDWLTPRNLQKR